MDIDTKIKINCIAITIGFMALFIPMSYKEEVFLTSWVILILTSTIYKEN